MTVLPNARRIAAGLTVCLMVSAMLVAVPVVLSSPHTAGATSDPSAASLQPGLGQFTPIDPVEIYDTRNATGGAPSSLAAGATSSPIPVLGVGGLIPTSGVEAVFVNIQVLSASGSGYLSDYEADDSANPGGASVSYGSGLAESGSDVVTIAPPGATNAGDILVTNNGSATITLAIQVEGYFQDGSQNLPGDTYMSVTSTNLVTNVSIPASSTSKFNLLQDAESDGLIASQDGGNVDALQIEVGTINPSAYGYLNFIGGNTYCNNPGDGTGDYVNLTSSLRQMAYQPNEKDRLTDIIQPELSLCNSAAYSNGDVQIANGGSSPVTIQIALDGYFINPTTTDIAGSEYTPIPNGPVAICDTRVNDPDICQDENGNVFSGAVPAGQSLTVQETGLDGIPAADLVSEVADEVDAVSPSSTGWLTVSPYGATPSTVPVVNFSSAYPGADVSFQNTVVTPTSSSGAITIYNNSPSGTVQIVVSARGFWAGATAPDPPGNPTSSFSSGQATVSWSGPVDNGAPLTGYVLKDETTGATTSVSALSSTATISASSADQIVLSASNAVGTSSWSNPIAADPSTQETLGAATWPLVLSGQILTMSGVPAPAGLTVTLTDSSVQGNVDVGQTAVVPSIGTATTDANGQWTFSIPSLDSLPQQIQDDVSSNSGYLNVNVQAFAVGTISNVSYDEMAIGNMIAYAGTGIITNATTGPLTLTLMAANQQQPASYQGDTKFTQESDFQSQMSSDFSSTDGPQGAGIDVDQPLPETPSDPSQQNNPAAVGVDIGSVPGTTVPFEPDVAFDGTSLSNAQVTPDVPAGAQAATVPGASSGGSATVEPSWSSFKSACNAAVAAAPDKSGYGNYPLYVEEATLSKQDGGYIPVGYVNAGTDDTSDFGFGVGDSVAVSTGFTANLANWIGIGATVVTNQSSSVSADMSSSVWQTALHEAHGNWQVKVLAYNTYSMWVLAYHCQINDTLDLPYDTTPPILYYPGNMLNSSNFAPNPGIDPPVILQPATSGEDLSVYPYAVHNSWASNPATCPGTLPHNWGNTSDRSQWSPLFECNGGAARRVAEKIDYYQGQRQLWTSDSKLTFAEGNDEGTEVGLTGPGAIFTVAHLRTQDSYSSFSPIGALTPPIQHFYWFYGGSAYDGTYRRYYTS